MYSISNLTTVVASWGGLTRTTFPVPGSRSKTVVGEMARPVAVVTVGATDGPLLDAVGLRMFGRGANVGANVRDEGVAPPAIDGACGSDKSTVGSGVAIPGELVGMEAGVLVVDGLLMLPTGLVLFGLVELLGLPGILVLFGLAELLGLLGVFGLLEILGVAGIFGLLGLPGLLALLGLLGVLGLFGLVGLLGILGLIGFVGLLGVLGLLGLVGLVGLLGLVEVVGLFWLVGLLGIVGLIGVVGLLGVLKVLGLLGLVGLLGIGGRLGLIGLLGLEGSAPSGVLGLPPNDIEKTSKISSLSNIEILQQVS